MDHGMMENVRDLDGKLVLVTGASNGIGRATARRFAAAGARLVVCDVDDTGLAALAGELGDRIALSRHVDVADRAAMAAFADEVHAIAPAVDVIVNNAGVAFGGGLLDTKLDDWDWVLGVNLWGVIHGMHFFVPPMVARGVGGHVVNVSSVLGLYGMPGVTAYVASKFAVRGLSQSIRGELAPHRIGVTAICPGMIATNIVEASRGGDLHARNQRRAAALFRKRGTSPDAVASAILAAVRRDRALVPVAPDGWAIWGLSRLAPSVLDRVTARFMRKLSTSS
jgi:NADP-dependent 3-hydroxy acid dehydrogenase YdfG